MKVVEHIIFALVREMNAMGKGRVCESAHKIHLPKHVCFQSSLSPPLVSGLFTSYQI
jgi:hypothetical protein